MKVKSKENFLFLLLPERWARIEKSKGERISCFCFGKISYKTEVSKICSEEKFLREFNKH